MPQNTFECILRNLFLCDNEQLDKWDKFSRFLPMIDEQNEDFPFFFNRETKSIVWFSAKQLMALYKE